MLTAYITQTCKIILLLLKEHEIFEILYPRASVAKTQRIFNFALKTKISIDLSLYICHYTKFIKIWQLAYLWTLKHLIFLMLHFCNALVLRFRNSSFWHVPDDLQIWNFHICFNILRAQKIQNINNFEQESEFWAVMG